MRDRQRSAPRPPQPAPARAGPRWRRNFPYALTSYSDLANGSLAGGEVSALDHVNSHLSVSSLYLFVFFVVQARPRLLS